MAPAYRLPGFRGAALFTSLKRMRPMRSTMDLTPLYRASIGFDRIADLVDRALASDIATPTYPPYNIEKMGENAYRISIAVAGFTADDLSVEMKDGAVIVSARKVEEDENRTFLHRGIATRAFERKFALADHVRVTGASHVDGMLHIDLVREVPEALKPRKIEISKSAAQTLEAEEVKKLDA
ncbi:molecular chaperone IbpA [Paracoccus chinensis]|uniref:Molecular chaperone IbpA n=2 Tax=Paracoccus chinensis TaxID=525640 RepID=A0A1G9FBG5_9RHOB|nr:molecular chaperone IbpA [Paracoccus chinensis]